MAEDVRIEWRGMNEFIQALKTAPVEIMDEAAATVKESAETMRDTVNRQYRLVSKYFIRNNARVRHVQRGASRVSLKGGAHIYELGTGQRHTKAGANRGQMPAKGPIFIPTAIRVRAQMVARMEQIARKNRGGRSTTSSLL